MHVSAFLTLHRLTVQRYIPQQPIYTPRCVWSEGRSTCGYFGVTRHK
jgi:hypothetical protein